MKSEINVCYIRLSELYRNYFKTRFGSPAIFSLSSEMSAVLRSHLTNNPTLARQTIRAASSFSDLAFNYKEKGTVIDADVFVPSEEEKMEFVAIVIPEEVCHYNGVVQTSNTWQPTEFGTKRLREIIKEEFWREYQKFSDDCYYRGSITGEKITREDIISEFMTQYNIPMKSYENLLRYETRHRKEMEKKIEKKRSMMEKFTGNNFIYT